MNGGIKSLQEAYSEEWSGAKCAFCLSTGRVGTDSLTALLEAASNSVAVHEPSPRLIHASLSAYREKISSKNINQWKELVWAARDDYVLEANQKGKVYVELSNRMTYLVPALAEAFPDSKYVFIHRHPYQVVRSAMRRGYYKWHPGDFARYTPISEPYKKAWNGMSHIEKSAWYWFQVNKDALDLTGQLGESRCMELRSEDLFSVNISKIARLFSFLGLQPLGKREIEKILKKPRNAQKQGQFPTADKWSKSDLDLVNKIVGNLAERLGYRLL